MAACDEVIASIVTQVTTSITTVVNNTMAYEDACCFLETNPASDPPASEANPPGTGAEWEKLCRDTQQAHDNGLEFLTNLFNYAEAGAGITAGVIALLAGGLVTLPLAIIGVLISAVVALVADEFTDEALLEWEALKKDVACCMINAATAAAAKSCIDDAIDESIQTAAIRTLFKAMYSMTQINAIWDGQIDGSNQSAFYCADCYDPQTPLEVWGFAFDVIDFVYTGENVSDAGIKWGNGGTGGDLTDTARAISPDDVGDFFTTFQIISPDFEPEKCEVANCYDDGNAGAPASDVFAVLSVWKSTGAGDDVSGVLGNWKLLVRPAGATTAPYWIPVHVDHLSSETEGVTLVNDQLIFSNTAWGSGQFGARTWFAVP